MKILVINAGSSSLKFQLLESGPHFECLAKGLIDNLGRKNCRFVAEIGKQKIDQPAAIKTY